MYVTDESNLTTFELNGIEYTAYIRHYDDGDTDVEVYPSSDISLDVSDDVQDYAESLLNP